MRAALRVCLLLTLASAAGAQQLDLFDPDDFVDPRLVEGQFVFVSRVVAGAARGYLDQFRPLGQDVAFVHVTNSIYWRGFQLDYKRTESRGREGSGEEDSPDFPQFQAYAIGEGEAPPPMPGPKNVTQLSWYQTFGERVTIRYRLGRATQYALRDTAARVRGIDDRDETRMAQLDAGMLLGRRMQYLTLAYAELTRHSTLEESRQRTYTASAYLPAVRLQHALLSPRLLIGSVSDGSKTTIVVNPSLDLSMRIPRVGAYLHLVYSPVYRDGLHHQVVVYADRALLVRAFGGRGE